VIDLNPLLLNVLTILLSIFVAQFVLYSMPALSAATTKLLFAAGATLCTILTMVFPFTLAPGNIYDLRKIPFLLSVLYGGRRVGFAVFVLMIAFRFSLGGFGAWSTLIVYSVLYLSSVLLKPLYDRSSILVKIAVSSVLAGAASSVGPFFDWVQNPVHYDWSNLEFYGYYFLLNLIVMAMAILLMENIGSYLIMRDESVRHEKIHLSNQLAAAVAHEVRNPLTVSRGFMQLLLNRGGGYSDAELRYIRTAIDEIDRAEAVISRFLSISRTDELQLQPVDVGEYFAVHEDLLLSLVHQQGCMLEVRVESGMAMVADRQIFTQVLVNIMKNAAESMPNGGTIAITARRINRKAEIKVTDEGLGMTAEQLKRLGTPFYSTKASGTGLGMMLSYNLIRTMNGRLLVNSRPNEGTSVTIVLPLYLAS
jgi:two-component system, sporulation sensor kinase B